MKWRKLAAICLSLSMMVTTLTACGGGGAGGIVVPGGDITESGETFAEQVNEIITERGYSFTVGTDTKLTQAIMDYLDTAVFTENMQTNTDQAEDAIGEMLGWGAENDGTVMKSTDGTVIVRSDAEGNTGDSPEDAVANLAIDIVENAKNTAKDIEIQFSVGKAAKTTEDGKVFWLMVVQYSAEKEAESPAEG